MSVRLNRGDRFRALVTIDQAAGLLPVIKHTNK
jgi:hypothetical protein